MPLTPAPTETVDPEALARALAQFQYATLYRDAH